MGLKNLSLFKACLSELLNVLYVFCATSILHSLIFKEFLQSEFIMVTMNFRITWAASESVDNHFKRTFQESRISETHMYAQSYQDFISIPENDGPMVDSHGRRLSYQRAVSGEDPMPSRYHEAAVKKKHSDKSEVSHAVFYKPWFKKM